MAILGPTGHRTMMNDDCSFSPQPAPDGPSSSARQTRRRILSPGFVGSLVVAVGVFAASSAWAGPGSIDTSASVNEAAERFADPNDLAFPINPLPTCEVLNNYGGYSAAFGASGHQGVDIGAHTGQEVYAVESGILYRQWTDLSSAPGLGWGLLSVTDTKYRYFHLASFAPDLAVGSYVQKGQLIGYVGDTGNATPGGWHLHFEVHPGPEPHRGTVDPVPLLKIPSSCRVYNRP